MIHPHFVTPDRLDDQSALFTPRNDRVYSHYEDVLTEFDLDRPQPQPPAPPRFANAFPCRCDRHSLRL